jgi:hypothetical protein
MRLGPVHETPQGKRRLRLTPWIIGHYAILMAVEGDYILGCFLFPLKLLTAVNVFRSFRVLFIHLRLEDAKHLSTLKQD